MQLNLSVSTHRSVWLKLSELLAFTENIHFRGFPAAFCKSFVFFYESIFRMRCLWASMAVEGGTDFFFNAKNV